MLGLISTKIECQFLGIEIMNDAQNNVNNEHDRLAKSGAISIKIDILYLVS